ncbi:MAG: diguanylate cyclase [Firmicutes bacterium]|nr:diguanylate cyclase [Bacillota bacterium]
MDSILKIIYENIFGKPKLRIYFFIFLWYIVYLLFIAFYEPVFAMHMILNFPVIISAMVGGLKAGLISALISNLIIIANLFVKNDLNVFFEKIIEYIPLLLNFPVVGIITGCLSNNMRHQNKRLKALYENLMETQSKYEFLYNTIKITSSILDIKELSEKLIELIDVSFGYSAIAILLVDEKNEYLEIVSLRHYQEKVKPGFRVKLGQGITGTAAQKGETVLVRDVTKDKRYIGGVEGARSELAVPIKHKGKVLGVLNIESKDLDAFTPKEIRYMELFAEQVSIAIANARLIESAKKQAITDELTNLYNYRYFINKLEKEVYEARRYKRPLTILMIDLDDFKLVNDTFGHPVGDQILKRVAAIICSNTRKSDIVARYGGEEFGIILPETDKQGGFIVADKIRNNISMIDLSCGELKNKKNKKIFLTASIGIATFPEDADNWERLIIEADNAMYRAKKQGKNLVIYK